MTNKKTLKVEFGAITADNVEQVGLVIPLSFCLLALLSFVSSLSSHAVSLLVHFVLPHCSQKHMHT